MLCLRTYNSMFWLGAYLVDAGDLQRIEDWYKEHSCHNDSQGEGDTT